MKLNSLKTVFVAALVAGAGISMSFASSNALFTTTSNGVTVIQPSTTSALTQAKQTVSYYKQEVTYYKAELSQVPGNASFQESLEVSEWKLQQARTVVSSLQQQQVFF